MGARCRGSCDFYGFGEGGNGGADMRGVGAMDWLPRADVMHQGNLAERIMHYNLHGGVDKGL